MRPIYLLPVKRQALDELAAALEKADDGARAEIARLLRMDSTYALSRGIRALVVVLDDGEARDVA